MNHYTRGSRNGNARLTAEDIYDIRTAPPETPRKTLAERFKVTPSAITAIRLGKTWSWLLTSAGGPA